MAAFSDSDFLADTTTFSLPEKDITFCLEAGDVYKVLQRLIEETDPTDKREKLVRPRFGGAIIEQLFTIGKLPTPMAITAIAHLPFTPEAERLLPRKMAQMIENGMMGLQVQVDEKWVVEGVEMELDRLIKDHNVDFSEEELAFFRLRARGDYYFHARAYLYAWKAYQDAEDVLPGKLKDHGFKKKTDILVEGTKLGMVLSKLPIQRLSPEQEEQRAAFSQPRAPLQPALENLEVNNPIGRLIVESSNGVLIEDASLSYLEEAFERLPSKGVERIELRFCKLDQGKLPRVFFRFPNLTHLTIDSCGLAKLTNNLAGFKRLRYLTIINAPSLTDLPLKLGGLSALYQLSIDRSGVTDIPFSIVECDQLQSISISNSRLTYVNGFLGELPQLTHAAFHHNRIDEVEEGFLEALRLRTLDLSSNRLEELPDRLHVLTRLELLNISQNPLLKVPAGILYMNTLRFLKIDGKTINKLEQYASFKEDLRKKIREGDEQWQQWQALF